MNFFQTQKKKLTFKSSKLGLQMQNMAWLWKLWYKTGFILIMLVKSLAWNCKALWLLCFSKQTINLPALCGLMWQHGSCNSFKQWKYAWDHKIVSQIKELLPAFFFSSQWCWGDWNAPCPCTYGHLLIGSTDPVTANDIMCPSP